MATRKKKTAKGKPKEVAPVTYPKTLGACVDGYYRLRETRIAKAREVEALRSREAAYVDHVLKTFSKDDLQGARGRIASASRFLRVVPTVEDWNKLYRHIKRTGDFDLLHRRVSDVAARARWDEKKVIPGVGQFTVVSLSVTRINT
jgi:hypothetical protein